MSVRSNVGRSVWAVTLLLLVLLHQNGSSFGFWIESHAIHQHHHHHHYTSATRSVSPTQLRPLQVVQQISRVSALLAADPEGHSEDSSKQHHETCISLSKKLEKHLLPDDGDDQLATATATATATGGSGSDNTVDGIAHLRRLSLVRTRLDGLQLNRTMLGPSTIAEAGQGLFASCDSKEGDLLTCYPGDALVTFLNDGGDGGDDGTISNDGGSSTVEYNVVWGNHVVRGEDEPALLVLNKRLREYLLHARDDYGVLGLPSLDEDPAYLGHFVNDGARLLSQNGFTDYILESFDKVNVEHQDVLDGSHMVLIAARDITRGEELFVTYGPDYWMEQPCFVDDGGSIDGDVEEEEDDDDE
jgi:hypothetical protein